MKLGGSGGSGCDPVTVAVAVKRAEGRGSRRAIRWAVQNLMTKDDCLLLVHVMPTITSVPTPSGGWVPIAEMDATLGEIYINDMKAKFEESLLKFKSQYQHLKIKILSLEGDNTASTLLRYISDSRCTILVLGSCSSNFFVRKTMESGVPSIILKHAPATCDVYVVSSNMLSSNSLNPMSNTGSNLGSCSLRKQESSLSSSSTESKFGTCFSDINSFSQENTLKSSLYSDSVFDLADQIGEVNISDSRRIRAFPSLSSTYLEQTDDIQAEVQRMRQELKDTVSMYNRACEDLIYAESKIQMLSTACMEEAQKVNAARQREESLRIMAIKGKEKYLEAEKEVQMAKALLEKETYERQMAQMKARKESLEKQEMVDALLSNDPRYRRYTREEVQMATEFFSENKMIGEGGYGKVYKCSIDHISVAVKVLRLDASDRKEEFLREVEVLSQLRHPHIVLLLGACPEIRCLIYEYMENGSLEDHIFCRKGRPSLSLFTRFRIAFEVACGLAFLHSSKPEPIVHRDIKPGNILLDKYFRSKIGDVGLAKLISAAASENVTEYQDTVVAGTFYYIDPEYARTGTVRAKSDLYAFGVIILQLLSARHPNGIITKFERAMSSGTLSDILDKSVLDWPLEEAHELADIALRCCNIRCRDRPDLETEVLPLLKRLVEFADPSSSAARKNIHAPKHYYCPILQEIMADPFIAADGFTYEYEAIKAWLERHDVSPVTKQILQHKMLTPNHVILSAIQKWRRAVTLPAT
ncbi:U-box domain-containing protein 34 [Dorcoceras hygrometricum]|uniref:RING-type E3 ubiquitin transferase n=1 Tax=Dorcoceras hygrometricum TaxID=472368 RepID=A0A2Z7AQW9_9LAMI|nr:U-box domain-containing protein 34 [Dorcoceras hygrometricum]